MRGSSQEMRASYRKFLAVQYDVAAWMVSNRLRQLSGILAKYSPTQPRVPAGSPDGGQWTSGAGGSGGTPDQPQNDWQQNQSIGGTGIEEFPRSPSSEPPIIDGIGRRTGDGRPTTPPFVPGRTSNGSGSVNVFASLGAAIGDGIDALGGATAVQVALNNPGKINKLITIDPVGPIRLGIDQRTKVPVYDYLNNTGYSRVSRSVGRWVDVYASGRPGAGNASNLAAWVGRRWTDEPNGYATDYVNAAENHGSFDTLLQTRLPNGWRVIDLMRP